MIYNMTSAVSTIFLLKKNSSSDLSTFLIIGH